MLGADRTVVRRALADARDQRRQGLPASPPEAMIADVVAGHLEYHTTSGGPEGVEASRHPGEAGETSPLAHMGMHPALREQVATDRPAGVAEVHRRLSGGTGDPHRAEHRVPECPGRGLRETRRAD